MSKPIGFRMVVAAGIVGYVLLTLNSMSSIASMMWM